MTLANDHDDVLISEDGVSTHFQQVGDVNVFYRAAGKVGKPVILLLHGFPSSSYQYRKLIPLLSKRFRVIAPDLPGFGSTVAPARGSYDYSFDQIGKTMQDFVHAIGLKKFSIYMFDYGAPIGFRIAMLWPDRVEALISQNGNVYDEGLTGAWGPIRNYWEDDSQENRDALRMLLERSTTEWQYYQGVPDALKYLIDIDSIDHDQKILDRDSEVQLDLFASYKTNVEQYHYWQAYMRVYQPRVLAIWGKNDPFFGEAGAKAFLKDVPQAEVVLLETGHFALETHLDEIAQRIERFFKV